MSENIGHTNRQLDLLHAQQASAWIQVLLDPTPAQRTGFIKWLKDSPRNVRDFLFMLTIEQALDRLDSHRLRDIEALLGQVDGRVVSLSGARATAGATSDADTPARTHAQNMPGGSIRKWLAITASLVAAALVAWVFLDNGSYGWKEFVTVTGEQRVFELEDGSVVHLNTNSRIAFRYSRQMRELRLLQGEALFRVHHEPTRPFRVSTSDALIQAVGTRFNVYARADGTEVAVIEGRVNVTPQPVAAKLGHLAMNSREPAVTRSVGANEEALVDHGGLLSVRAVPDVTEVVAWRERRLVFRNETLEHIVSEFNRYTSKQIRLEGGNVRSRLFTGVFDADDPESLAQVLERDSTLSVSYSDRSIVVNAR